ncbi:hypothetical protein R3W88_030625 [Solanum pinnatisectum]|uniref:Uncharacterized protein n=1 Tax=Solanum pinnatisectum TaxID=50273 RepID=A0AAV9LJL8_9SOLN|nr:hypothetical protein R3W88_030625 [Solanum pinnatisectum]
MFSRLASLRRLHLSNNYFSGELEDFKYNSLEEIILGGNQLQGQIPKSIQNLENLSALDLSFNNFSGNVDISLFSNLKQLLGLVLSYNKISLINENKTVDTIDLRSTLLQGSLPIPPNSTRYFLISQNNLTEEIPPSICNLTSLIMLDLARNNLKGAIPQCLGSISGLEVLDLHNNKLSGNIPTIFRNGSSLRSLNLHGNKLEGKIP